MIGEFLLELLKFDKEGNIVYAKRLKHAHFKIGDMPFTFRHNKASESPEYFRICDKAYKSNAVRELLFTKDPDIMDGGFSTPSGRAKRDEVMFNLFSEGKHAQWIARKYNNISTHAVEAAAQRHARWRVPIVVPKPQTQTPPVPTTTPEDPAILAERQSKIAAVLAAWGDDDVVYETKPTPVQPVHDTIDETLAYIDEILEASNQVESIATYNDPQTEEVWVDQAKINIEYYLQEQGFSAEDIALWVSHRLTR